VCGIAGYFTVNNERNNGEMTAIANGMANAIEHRGPDSSGVWVSEQVGLALAHRRLSIIDLSTNGNQPMCSQNGQYVIVFNGEIYNHRELRQELLSCGKTFRGHSDTEVILAGCEEWGVEQTIKKCVGMFAIALWDVKGRNIYLIRDRMGEKPLYYGWQKGTFIFASELKAMRRHPDFQGDIDRNSLSLYFRHRYIPGPYSVYKDVYKLEPGMILRISVSKTFRNGNNEGYEKLRYWSLNEVVKEVEFRKYGGAEEAVNALEGLLVKSIEGQMIADVPLGAFLSGGIDSSTIVALMQRLSSKPTKTFCIGFKEQGYNEAVYAKKIARHLGCEHTELYVTPQQLMDVIPNMPRLYDEPFADGSQIPTFLVSRLARQHVTVSLSGDAGDELFYGYSAYSLEHCSQNQY
jgi:asparagine synthase (glutamine-hydrolysing)